MYLESGRRYFNTFTEAYTGFLLIDYYGTEKVLIDPKRPAIYDSKQDFLHVMIPADELTHWEKMGMIAYDHGVSKVEVQERYEIHNNDFWRLYAQHKAEGTRHAS